MSRRQFYTRDGRALAKPGRYANAVRSHCHHLHNYPWCTTPDCPRGPERHERHPTIEEISDAD